MCTTCATLSASKAPRLRAVYSAVRPSAATLGSRVCARSVASWALLRVAFVCLQTTLSSKSDSWRRISWKIVAILLARSMRRGPTALQPQGTANHHGKRHFLFARHAARHHGLCSRRRPRDHPRARQGAQDSYPVRLSGRRVRLLSGRRTPGSALRHRSDRKGEGDAPPARQDHRGDHGRRSQRHAAALSARLPVLRAQRRHYGLFRRRRTLPAKGPALSIAAAVYKGGVRSRLWTSSSASRSRSRKTRPSTSRSWRRHGEGRQQPTWPRFPQLAATRACTGRSQGRSAAQRRGAGSCRPTPPGRIRRRRSARLCGRATPRFHGSTHSRPRCKASDGLRVLLCRRRTTQTRASATLAKEFVKEEAEHVETLKHWIAREQAGESSGTKT